MRAARSKRSVVGFTIVEVIVAMGIFAMVIAGGLAGIHRGYTVLQDARYYTRVSQILQSEVETLRTFSWEQLTSLPSNLVVPVDTQFDTNVYDMFTVRRRIISEEDDLRRVIVTVSYKTDRGRLITLNYVTFFTKGGVNDYFYRTI